ncbi:MAG TPA: hypothetical protein VKY74_07330, partial [Chloroflexia bacterium]|nr:hypothetical protein [Chloroflexia bacterium]
AKNLAPNMSVRVALATVQKADYGLLLGTVRSVDQLPLEAQAMRTIVGNSTFADELTADGALIKVVVSLQKNPANPSGYQWTSRTGPPLRPQTGTLCTATVTLQEPHPISLLFPGH